MKRLRPVDDEEEIVQIVKKQKTTLCDEIKKDEKIKRLYSKQNELPAIRELIEQTNTRNEKNVKDATDSILNTYIASTEELVKLKTTPDYIDKKLSRVFQLKEKLNILTTSYYDQLPTFYAIKLVEEFDFIEEYYAKIHEELVNGYQKRLHDEYGVKSIECKDI